MIFLFHPLLRKFRILLPGTITAMLFSCNYSQPTDRSETKLIAAKLDTLRGLRPDNNEPLKSPEKSFETNCYESFSKPGFFLLLNRSKTGGEVSGVLNLRYNGKDSVRTVFNGKITRDTLSLLVHTANLGKKYNFPVTLVSRDSSFALITPFRMVAKDSVGIYASATNIILQKSTACVLK